MSESRPNIILVFPDQWRAQAAGYGGDPNVKTPSIDRLAGESVNFTHALSGCPVCTPARASLLTGQYPLTTGLFVNDVPLSDRAVGLAQAFADAGYDTAYIGKWHVDGHGRSNYIPPERRQGFDYWKVLECSHDYNRSFYYAGDSDEKLTWEGYDAIAQTRDAQSYIHDHDGGNPFLMVLSWGPPHAPYETAPERYRHIYRPEEIILRPNVPQGIAPEAREWLAGYYAHCTALDDCTGDLLATIEEEGIAEDTIFLFFSDHGDMLGSQGSAKKQQPWEESIRIPFLLRYPTLFGREGRENDALIDVADVMPTLLGLCGLPIPDTVESIDFSGYLNGGPDPSVGAAVIQCPHTFGQWSKAKGGREYRGLRTHPYTYVRSLDGSWMLYNNDKDPHQLTNLVSDPAYSDILDELDTNLQERLDARGDEFRTGMEYIEEWGYEVDENGTVPTKY